MQRTSGAEEAILLASSAHAVRDYLIKRAVSPNIFDPISKEAEGELLGRGERLIDLSLAEYCLYRETAQALFERDPSDWPIRSLVLSNQALGTAEIIGRFPEVLFGSEEALLSYLSTISSDELSILFRNPSLDERFLEEFLSLGKPWNAMEPRQRLWALDGLGRNEKLQKARSALHYDEGWDWYMAGKPFEAAWSLIFKLEPNEETAKHLSSLLRDLPADSFKTEGIADALGNWQAAREEQLADEEKDNSRGRLSDFQQVRQSGARLLAARHDATPGLFLDSDDVALRCGAYEAAAKLDEDTIEAAVRRDGDLARVHLVRNERLWRSEKTRDLLLDTVLRHSEGEEPRWEFRRRDQHYRREFPAWFEGDQYAEPDERPISESSIADVVSGVASAPVLKGLQDRLAQVEKAQQRLFWMLAVALVILVTHAWR